LSKKNNYSDLLNIDGIGETQLVSIKNFFSKNINLKILNYEKRIQTKKNTNSLSSIFVGMAFGFGWTPCIGPILGSILALASVEESLNRGIILLFFYSLGLAIPFIISGYLIQKFMIFSKNLKSEMRIISKVGGGMLFATGLLIITNQLQALGFYLIKYIPVLQNLG
jgi:cytochrome c-type biogenesis protein